MTVKSWMTPIINTHTHTYQYQQSGKRVITSSNPVLSVVAMYSVAKIDYASRMTSFIRFFFSFRHLFEWTNEIERKSNPNTSNALIFRGFILNFLFLIFLIHIFNLKLFDKSLHLSVRLTFVCPFSTEYGKLFHFKSNVIATPAVVEHYIIMYSSSSYWLMVGLLFFRCTNW